MTKFSRKIENQRKKENKKPVENFMGGISFEYNPIDTLKMVTASSIFGEPQYYRDGEFSSAKVKDGLYYVNDLFAPYSILSANYDDMKTSEMMETIIDEALDYDFKATLEWAVTLRKDFLMRLNPQIIMVRAAIHPKRQQFNEINPGFFSQLQKLHLPSEVLLHSRICPFFL